MPCLCSCIIGGEEKDPAPQPVLRLRLALPAPQLTDYAPTKAGTRTADGTGTRITDGTRTAADETYIIRCVAEFTHAGTDRMVLHRSVTPQPQPDGTCLVELAAPEGSYDLRLWADYARTDAPLTDTFYQTDNLRAVTIATQPYVADTDAKDAAYHSESSITLPATGTTTIDVQLQRPLAKYRILADDVAAYRALTAADPQQYPPLEELTVTVQYEGYFPSVFNAAEGVPSNALQGLSFASTLPDVPAGSEEVQIATDWIMTSGEETFVKASIVIYDRNGTAVTRTTGTKIAHKRNRLTTLRGNFLTAGTGSGGVSIDTEWEDTYQIEF